ncbi:MAG: hypothetical protein DSY43_00505 [Gammaproteobacteria bacterium]|nr:MAG: hypothetical protein DSY43_00505 [Gammaproteobacteria bacterium]
MDILLPFNSAGLLVEWPFMRNEVWIKIGGDKGGRPTSSMKMCYQVCNVKAPNSRDNTVCFLIYEANDTIINLKTALTQYRSQIDELQDTTWR